MQAVINGISMAYDDRGSGPAVVLVHGFPLCRRMWHPQVNALTGAGYRVILPDLRGFGESDAPEGPYSMDLFADDIAALLDHLEIDRAVVGGMSMGGYVLFNLVERYRSRVAAACFIVTRAAGDDDLARARRLKLAQDVMKFGPQTVVGPFEETLFAAGTMQERPRLIGEVYGWMNGTDSRGLAGGLLAMRERKDYTPMLGSFLVPALSIGADEDRAVSPENARAIAAGIPGCRFCLIPQAGHMANLEHPGAFNDCLLAFLGEVRS